MNRFMFSIISENEYVGFKVTYLPNINEKHMDFHAQLKKDTLACHVMAFLIAVRNNRNRNYKLTFDKELITITFDHRGNGNIYFSVTDFVPEVLMSTEESDNLIKALKVLSSRLPIV